MQPMDQTAFRSKGAGFYRDVVKILLYPGQFFEEMPDLKQKREAVTFLCICVSIYSAAATIFAYENHFFYFLMFLANGLLIPIVTFAALFLVLFLTGAGRTAHATVLCIVAYAGVSLLFAWIPGMAPFAEIYKYYLVGLGLLKTGKMSLARAIATLLATIALLWLVLYFAQILTGNA